MLPFATALLLASAAGGGGGSPYGSHIGWRVIIDAGGDGSFVSIHEAQLRTVSGGTSDNSGTAFQGGPGTDAGNGVNAPWDANLANNWARTVSGGFGMYFGRVYSSAKSIVEIALYGTGSAPTPQNQCPTKFRLQYSDNTTTGSDGTWTDAFSAWEESWLNGTSDWRVWPQDFSGGKYKSLRLLIQSTVSGGFPSVTKMEFHATVGGADICTGGNSNQQQLITNANADKMFDANDSSNFQPSNAMVPIWGQYSFPTPISKPAEYSIRDAFGTAYGITQWKIQGSTDGVTWTDLDTQSGITWASVPLTKTFAVP